MSASSARDTAGSSGLLAAASSIAFTVRRVGCALNGFDMVCSHAVRTMNEERQADPGIYFQIRRDRNAARTLMSAGLIQRPRISSTCCSDLTRSWNQ